LGFVSVSTEGFGKLIKPASLYWDLMDHFKMQKDGFNPFTPAIHTINALKFSLEMILNKGIENIWQETNRLASAFREAILVGGLELFPQKPASGLTVIKLPDNIKDQQVINELEKSSGYRIAGGQEELAGKVIRIAHMGAVSFEDIKRLIAPLFDTLQRLGHDCQSELVYEKFVKTYSSL
jgi:aspartate aminotransferase-like enzyme